MERSIRSLRAARLGDSVTARTCLRAVAHTCLFAQVVRTQTYVSVRYCTCCDDHTTIVLEGGQGNSASLKVVARTCIRVLSKYKFGEMF